MVYTFANTCIFNKSFLISISSLFVFKFSSEFIGQYLITHLSPSHVPDIFTFKLKMFSYDLFTIRVSDSGVDVKKRQNSTDVNNRQTTEIEHQMTNDHHFEFLMHCYMIYVSLICYNGKKIYLICDLWIYFLIYST